MRKKNSTSGEGRTKFFLLVPRLEDFFFTKRSSTSDFFSLLFFPSLSREFNRRLIRRVILSHRTTATHPRFRGVGGDREEARVYMSPGAETNERMNETNEASERASGGSR